MEPGRPSTSVFGRDPGNDFVIADKMASRVHGKIERRRERFYYVDQSTNGTYVTNEGDVRARCSSATSSCCAGAAGSASATRPATPTRRSSPFSWNERRAGPGGRAQIVNLFSVSGFFTTDLSRPGGAP